MDGYIRMYVFNNHLNATKYGGICIYFLRVKNRMDVPVHPCKQVFTCMILPLIKTTLFVACSM